MANFNFTYPVPDELWVENWSNGLTGTLVYKGPAEVNLWFDHSNKFFVGSDFDLDSDQDGFPDTTEVNEKGLTKLTVRAADGNKSIAAMWLAKLKSTDQETFAMDSDEFPDETTTRIQTDGRDYLKITNPRPDHLFMLQMDEFDGSAWELEHKIKSPEAHTVYEARRRRNRVSYYQDTFDLGAGPESDATAFISATNTYIADRADHYPWQFITIPKDVPKIPLSVMTAISNIKNAMPDVEENMQYVPIDETEGPNPKWEE